MDKLPTITPKRNLSKENYSLPCDPSGDAHTANLVSRYRGLIVWRPDDGGPKEAAAVPSEGERLALVSRHKKLEDTLLPASTTATETARVAAAVTSMLRGGYTSLQNVDKRATIAGYTEALQDLPAWASERACEAVRKGKVEGLNPDWPPTHARLHQIASAELAPVRGERHAIEEVLKLQAPEQPDEAARARIAESAKAWLDRTDPIARRITHGDEASIVEKTEADKETAQRNIDRNNDDIRREWASLGREPMTGGDGTLISVSLAKALGRYAPPAQEGEAA